jgi:hypothetical protein
MTLKRYVNGQVVPIKLSILDALRSSPPPRKKKRVNSVRSQNLHFYCNVNLRFYADIIQLHDLAFTGLKQSLVCSGKYDCQDLQRMLSFNISGSGIDNLCTQKNSTASATPNAATAATRTVQAQAAPAIVTDSASGPTTLITKQGEDEAHTFTDADDAKLIEMKAAGRTWKEIVAEMKKSQSGLKERFKEIGSNAGSGAGSGPGEKNTGEEGQSQKAASTGKNGHKDASSAGETTAKVCRPLSSTLVLFLSSHTSSPSPPGSSSAPFIPTPN